MDGCVNRENVEVKGAQVSWGVQPAEPLAILEQRGSATIVFALAEKI